VLDGVRDPLVLGAELHGRPLSQRTGTGCTPVVAVVMTAGVLETGSEESLAGDVGVGWDGEIDIERASRLLRVKLHGHTANEGIGHALSFEQLCSGLLRMAPRRRQSTGEPCSPWFR
jgi:hypothetical protein